MYKFNEYQEKWLHDLETTGAKQIRNYLRDGRGGFCCLGRACKVMNYSYGRNFFDDPVFWVNDTKNGEQGEQDDEKEWIESELDDELVTKLKLRDGGGTFIVTKDMYDNVFSDYVKNGYEGYENISEGSMISLIHLNDDFNFSFKKIAAFIRKYPYDIFVN